ncbi:phytanoyl-CoA dioxygenase family protein [Paraburkholderia sediminicola]|uniref:phytanoyl-CoA dioxygenase family protein n=1 Tax=Paraburkholderia sediminicola TaxID=458836 RepID=UPI000E73E432
MNEHPIQALTHADIQTFRRDGVVCLRGLLDAEWIEHLRGAIEVALEKAADNPNARDIAAEAGKVGRFHNEQSLWKTHQGFLRFIEESPISEVAAWLTGSESIWLYNDHLLVKEPGTDAPTPWHQDGTYFRLTGEQAISVWIGLDPVRRETGAMSFVKGSHAWNRMFRPRAFATGNDRDSAAFDGPLPDIDGNPVLYQTVCYEMEPGDVTIHHALTIHGALGNSSATMRRRGYSIRMAGDDARYADRKWTAYSIGEGLRDGAPIEGHPDFPSLWPRI